MNSQVDYIAATAALERGVDYPHINQAFVPPRTRRLVLANAIDEMLHLPIVHDLRTMRIARVRVAGIDHIDVFRRPIGDFQPRGKDLPEAMHAIYLRARFRSIGMGPSPTGFHN